MSNLKHSLPEQIESPKTKVSPDQKNDATEGSQGSIQSSSSDSYLQDSSPSPPSDTCTVNLPTETCKWKRHHVEELKLYIDETTYHATHPKRLIKLLLENRYLKDRDYSKWKENVSNLKRLTCAMTEAALGTQAYRVLDCPFDDLSVDKAAVKLLGTCSDLWDIASDLGNDLKLKKFKTSFEAGGAVFADKLLQCLHVKNENETITENMFMHLFISFLQLFNLRCQFVPCIPKKRMYIHGQTVSGEPDIVGKVLKFIDNPKPTMDWRTLFICEAKKKYFREDITPAKKTRLSSSRSSTMSTLPNEILGQYCGELLLYYPTSVTDENIIGMILEKTHITFVALSMTRQQHEQLLKGTLKNDIENGPKVFLTKSYDYLVWKDRQYVTEALFMLGFLQNYGSEYFL